MIEWFTSGEMRCRPSFEKKYRTLDFLELIWNQNAYTAVNLGGCDFGHQFAI